MNKLNIGSGEFKLESYINIDSELSTKPDLVCDLKKNPLPFKSESIELIHMFHSLEHIEKRYWSWIFDEFRRVLKLDGQLFLAYPEFEKCSKNFLENYLGLRDLFRATLYGRQLYPGDYHVVPMVTSEVISELQHFGFYDFKSGADPDENWNSLILCKKGPLPMIREDVLRNEIFKKA